MIFTCFEYLRLITAALVVLLILTLLIVKDRYTGKWKYRTRQRCLACMKFIHKIALCVVLCLLLPFCIFIYKYISGNKGANETVKTDAIKAYVELGNGKCKICTEHYAIIKDKKKIKNFNNNALTLKTHYQDINACIFGFGIKDTIVYYETE